MRDWIQENGTLLAWLGALGLATFLGTLMAVPLLVARMPTDFFLRKGPPPGSRGGLQALLRLGRRAAKNLLGGVLILAGIAMLLLPGQGVLTILAGVILVDFPGKRRLELGIVRRPRVRRTLDWIRARAGRPPLEMPPIARGNPQSR